MTVTSEDKEGSTYKYLSIKPWPADWSNTKFVCKVFKKADNTVLFTSEAITLTSSGEYYSVVISRFEFW